VLFPCAFDPTTDAEAGDDPAAPQKIDLDRIQFLRARKRDVHPLLRACDTVVAAQPGKRACGGSLIAHECHKPHIRQAFAERFLIGRQLRCRDQLCIRDPAHDLPQCIKEVMEDLGYLTHCPRRGRAGIRNRTPHHQVDACFREVILMIGPPEIRSDCGPGCNDRHGFDVLQAVPGIRGACACDRFQSGNSPRAGLYRIDNHPDSPVGASGIVRNGTWQRQREQYRNAEPKRRPVERSDEIGIDRLTYHCVVYPNPVAAHACKDRAEPAFPALICHCLYPGTQL